MKTPLWPAALVLLTACSPDARCGLHACDIRATDCQQTAAAAAACLLGQPPQQIPIALVTRSQYIAGEIAAAHAGDVAREQRRLDALVLLDLADGGVTPEQAATSLSDRVAAFYDPAVKKITIVTDDNSDTPLDGATNMSLLVHESTHALQDARGRLAYPPPDGDRSYDRAMAQAALIEGEASLTESLTTLALFEHDVAKVPWEPVFTRLHALGTRIAAAAPVPIDLAYSYFAYPFGLSTMYRGYAALGPAGLDAIWASPPVSTRQILLDPGAPELGSPLVEDLGPESVPELPAEFAFVDGDRTGAFVFQLFVLRAEQHSRVPLPAGSRALALAANLRGDYLSLWNRANARPAAVAIWRLRFSSTEQATLAWEHLDRVQRWTASARPALWSPRQQDRDVILTAPAADLLAATATWKAPPPPPAPPAASASAAPRAATICPRPLAAPFTN